jgi:hypothetical protein
VALSQDVEGESYDFPDYFFQKRVHRIRRPQPVREDLNDLVELIAASRKPMVICGGGVRYSEAGEVLERFCETFKIPFAETQAGKSACHSSHPMNLGGVGVTGNLAANTIARDADLIISVGSRMSDFTTGRTDVWISYISAMFEDVKLLLFGQGCTRVLLGEKATHNTLLQCVFQLGIIGIALLILWIVFFFQTLLRGVRLQKQQIVRLAMVLIGTFGPWIALDYLFFDEFFLLPIFVCMAVRFLHQQQEQKESLLE